MSSGQSPRRLEQLIRSNLVGDLAAQAIILALPVLLLRNQWILAVWLVRWVVVLAVWSALRIIRSGNANKAILILIAGHTFGILASCALLPEFGPLTMLVLIGDIGLVPEVTPRWQPRFIGALMMAAAASALLSLQSWTGLAQSAPEWIVVVSMISHSTATGLAIAASHRSSYYALSSANERLEELQHRIGQAVHQGRNDIAEALANGPARDLSELEASTRRLTTQIESAIGGSHDFGEAKRGAEESVASTQEALRRLRLLSHGRVPEILREHGLRIALQSMITDRNPHDRYEVTSERCDVTVEAAAYVCAIEVAQAASERNAPLHLSVTLDGETLNLHATIMPGSESSPFFVPTLVADRIGALGGDITVDALNGRSQLDVHLPLQADEPEVKAEHTPSLGFAKQASNERILSSFVRSSFIAAILGLSVAIGLWLTFHNSALAWVAAVMCSVLVLLVIARHFLKQRNFGACVLAICCETGLSGIFVTWLEPRSGIVTGLITSLPVVLALPHFSSAALRRVTVAQVAALIGVLLIGFAGQRAGRTTIDVGVLRFVLPLAAAGVAFLVVDAVLATMTETKAAAASVRASLRRFVADADAQRQQIERDLHDGAQQHFVALSMQFRIITMLLPAKPLEALEAARNTVDDIVRTRSDVLAMSDGASVPLLGEGRLGEALRAAATRSMGRFAVTTSGAIDHLDPTIARAVYFCCQEAVQNAMKHAGPSADIAVQVTSSLDHVSFSVTDNGVGFDGEHHHSGRGIQSLKDRISSIGGEVTVSSKRGKGTAVSGALPFHREVVTLND